MTVVEANGSGGFRLSFLPIPALAGLMAAIYFTVDPAVFYDPAWLILVGNTLFITVVSLIVSYIALRNYHVTGRLQILLLGCAVLLFGIGGVVAAIVRGLPEGANLNVTIYNTGALLGAAFHAVAAFILVVGASPEMGFRRRGVWLCLGYAGSALFMALITLAAVQRLIPPFFVQGVGPTLLRQQILGTADLLFIFSAVVFLGMYLRNREVFLYWYGCALALTAISLTAFFLQSSVGSPIGWIGRFSQYVGGVYFLLSLLSAGRGTQSRGTSVDNVLAASLEQAEQRNRFQAGILAQVSDAVIATDNQQRITYLNRAAEERYEIAAAAARGRPLDEVYRCRWLQAEDEAALQPALAKHGQWQGENIHVTRAGREIPVESTVTELRDEHGKSIGLLATIHDLTARRQAEAALRLSEERFALAFANSPAALALTRFVDGLFLDVNDTWLVLNGYSRDDVIGRSAEDIQVWPTAEARARFVQELRGTGFLHWREQDFRTKSGESYTAQVSAQVLSVQGEKVILSTVMDITDRKRAEAASQESTARLQSANAELRESRRAALNLMDDAIAAREQAEQALHALAAAKAAAEAANEAKSQFLANMSHELRTPMNAILGMIDVALPKAMDPTVQDCLQTAKGSADLLLTLLNDLLDSAKIESGKLELESAAFSLRRMLDQLTRVLAVRASEKGLSFYCRMPDETPDAVVGDRMRLQQVLLNLAGNAIKFTEKGEVEIRLRASSDDVEACLEFAVRDTGIGIPPSGQERLFQPFAQADASMSRRFGGTGLGLSICKSLVEMMGGRIWVESEFGFGSTFCFTVRLPLAKDLPADFEAPAALPTAACGHLRVLLVEDNPANQKLTTYLLQDRGHSVEIAGDGQEAIGLAERNRYDVILMDVQMPGMDGLEATAAIRKRENEAAGGKGDRSNLCEAPEGPFRQIGPVPFSGRRVPIIAMTAHAMKGDRDRCLSAGMDGYLSKPVVAREMIGLVESLARGAVPVAQIAAVAPGLKGTLPGTTSPVFDADEALTRCFNSADMVREMIQCLFEDVDSLFPQMRAALAKGDLAEVGRLGHRMKGTVVYLGAQPAKEAAVRVERFCKSDVGTPSEAEEAVNALQHECIVLKAALSAHPLATEPTQK